MNQQERTARLNRAKEFLLSAVSIIDRATDPATSIADAAEDCDLIASDLERAQSSIEEVHDALLVLDVEGES